MAKESGNTLTADGWFGIKKCRISLNLQTEVSKKITFKLFFHKLIGGEVTSANEGPAFTLFHGVLDFAKVTGNF